MVYTVPMRRIQIYLEEKLDDALKAEAASSGRAKAELIRECVAAHYRGLPGVEDDPLNALVGSVDVEPAEIDEVVYGR